MEQKVMLGNSDKIFRLQDLIDRKILNFQCNKGFVCREKSFIAMFHNIVNLDQEIDDRYTCTKEQFEQFLLSMIDQNIVFISLAQLLCSKCITKNTCILTFDDGFESVFTIALPILKKLKIPFTVYITSSFVGHSNYLKAEQVVLLSKEQLCSIGLHAHNHLSFRGKPDEDVKNEFRMCKEYLFELTGEVTNHAAFPYGSHYACSRQNIIALKNDGIQSIAMTYPRFLNRRDVVCPYALPRINVPSLIQNGKI